VVIPVSGQQNNELAKMLVHDNAAFPVIVNRPSASANVEITVKIRGIAIVAVFGKVAPNSRA
jgi:hypothetical protein